MNSAKVYHMKPILQKHQDPLDLGSLPLLSPPRDGWPAIEATLRQDAGHRSARRRLLFGLAAAASLTLTLVVVLSGRTPGTAATVPAVAQQSIGTKAEPALGPTTAPDTLDALIGVSQGLENRLRALRFELGNLPAQTVIYQAELEDLIVQVDEQLSRQPDSLTLWNQRVALLLDLEQLYEQGLRREYARMASL